ncbi:MAG: sugar nucleotide-binding protein [Chloroflexi bacterium]|nr:sugar nucleotide-binding protein [Chloroflexota bacterium]
MPRLLVTGASGLLGFAVVRAALGHGWTVTAAVRSHKTELLAALGQPIEVVEQDLAEASALPALVSAAAPEAIIHTAAMSRPDDCAARPELAQAVNVEATGALAAAAHKKGAHFVFTSSDLVYGVNEGELFENGTPPAPLGVYAATKLAGEHAVLGATSGLATIARMSLMYGWGSGAHQCFAEEWLAALRARRPVRAFTDQFRRALYADDAADLLLALAVRRLAGVYNAAGPELTSRYTFALRLASSFGCDESLVQPTRQADFAYADPRPNKLDLSTAKVAKAIARQPSGPEDGLKRMKSARPA